MRLKKMKVVSQRLSRMPFSYSHNVASSPIWRWNLENLQKKWEARVAKENPAVLVGRVSCLAEMVKSAKGRGSFQLGKEFFANSEAAVEFIRNECKVALVYDAMSVHVNITIAEIFSAVLPHWLRDPRFAKQCIERALLFHPNSSKANNRMGIFLLTEENDPDQALKYFEHAVEGDERNFPALLQLLSTYMAKHVVNGGAISEIFERQLNSSSSLSCERKGTLHFQKGIFEFMNQDYNSAFNSWVEAYKQCKDSVKSGFEKLVYTKRRFGWNQSNLDYDLILSQLEHSQNGDKSRATFEIRMELIKFVRGANDRERNYAGRGGGRGGGNRGRGFGSTGFGRGFPGAGFSRGRGRKGYNRGGGGQRQEWREQGHGDRGSSHGSENRQQKPTVVKPMDHYATLQIQPGATKDVIKKAYKMLAMKYHPDKNGHLQGAAKEANLELMKNINVAYEALV